MKITWCGDSAFVISEGPESVASDGVRIRVCNIQNEPVGGSLVLREVGQADEKTYSLSGGRCTRPSAALLSGEKYEFLLAGEKKRISAGEIFVTVDGARGKCIYPIRSDERHAWRVLADIIAFLGKTSNKLDAHVDGADVI